MCIVRDIKTLKRDSIWYLTKRLIEELNLNSYCKISSNIQFNNGSEIIFSGLSEQTIDGVKGLDKIKYFYFDEAHNISGVAVRTLIPSIRDDNSQIIFAFNPQYSEDFLYKEYILKQNEDYHKSILVNYIDNPFFNDTLERDRIRDYNTLPRQLYNHIWLGETNDYNDMLVIDTTKLGFYDKIEAYQSIIISIDTATSIKSSADYSVISILGKVKNSNDTHIVHILRGRFDWHTLMQKIKDVYNLCHKLTSQNANVILVEAKANGLNVIQELQRLTHLNVKAITPINDKLTRVVDSLLPYIDNVKLPIDKTNIFNFWIDDFLKECNLFRADGKHEHDDMIDSITQGLNYIYNKHMDFNKIKEALTI